VKNVTTLIPTHHPKTGRPLQVAEQVLLLLIKVPRANTMWVARELGKHYIYIRNLLHDLKRRGYVEFETVRRYMPDRRWILQNEWEITSLGKGWLEKRRLL